MSNHYTIWDLYEKIAPYLLTPPIFKAISNSPGVYENVDPHFHKGRWTTTISTNWSKIGMPSSTREVPEGRWNAVALQKAVLGAMVVLPSVKNIDFLFISNSCSQGTPQVLE